MTLQPGLFKKKHLLHWMLSGTVIGIIFFSAFVYMTEQKAAKQRHQTDTEWSLVGRAVTAQDHSIGNIAAPVEVIVYSNFSCKDCATFFENQVPKLQRMFGYKVVFAYRHRVLTPQPNEAAEDASECVYQSGGNDSFWKFAADMFSRPSAVSALTQTELTAAAIRAGVDEKTFVQCMKTGGGKGRVAKDTLEASVAGMSQDPSYLLKSAYRATVIKGDQSSQIVSSIQYLLDTSLQIEKLK